MKMRITILIMLFAATALYAVVDQYLQSFTAVTENNYVRLEWRPITENGISRYEIERSVSNQDFNLLTRMNVAGNSVYNYTDNDVYFRKGSDGNNVQSPKKYAYRIKIVRSDNSYTYSNNVPTVYPKLSGVRRTWGMIKELFK